MTKVTVYQDEAGAFTGFRCEGHSGYADAGSDVVCAAISALVINTVNAIEELTDTDIRTHADEGAGVIEAFFQGGCSAKAELLVKAMIMGLQGIQSNYGTDYLTLETKEGEKC